MGGSVEGPSDGREGREDVDDQYCFVDSDDDAGRPTVAPRMLETRTSTRSRRPRSANGVANGATTADGTRTSTRSRRPRSANGVANGATTADGTMRSSPTSPTRSLPRPDTPRCPGPQ